MLHHLISEASRKLLPSAYRLSTTRLLSTTTTTANMGAIGTQMVDTTDRLARLRKLMKKPETNVNAFVVPTEDQHFSEYIADCDARRAFISGFTGSAGCAIVTDKEALLFTDGRYFLQAEKQLDSNWTLMKQGLPDVPSWQDYLSKNIGPHSRIGIDSTLISASDAEIIKTALTPIQSELVPVEENLVDLVWADDRPARPQNPVFHLDVKYSGKSHSEKLRVVRAELKREKAKAVVVTMLDEVAWLFNLRGSDIDYNPVFFAYAIVTPAEAILFVNESQLGDQVRKALGEEVQIRPYDSFFDYLKGTPAQLSLSKDSPMILGDKSSLAVVSALQKENTKITMSPIANLKAIKNKTELEGFRQCHIRDGVALARYFAWLEHELQNGSKISESEGADQLEKYRSELEGFRGLSFTTISGTGPNGAIIHYSPDPKDCATIEQGQVYLCDSGGQFTDGTTDVTRTMHFGTPTKEEKRAFTRVLQGHIAIDSAVVPNGTTGYIIDSWARRALWKDGLDFRHGTGHGVGHFLNVHEGPHGIGVRITLNNSPLQAGMTITNEPGYYADGRFGIRIENVMLVQEAKTPNNFGDKGFLRLERVTMSPIQKNMVDVELLGREERQWLDEYHQEVWDKLSPLLKNDEQALEWLKRETSPL